MWHIHMSIGGSFCFLKIPFPNNISETSILRFAGCFNITDVIEPTTDITEQKEPKNLECLWQQVQK